MNGGDKNGAVVQISVVYRKPCKLKN